MSFELDPPKKGALYYANGFPGVVLVAKDGSTYVLTGQSGWIPYELREPVAALTPYGSVRSDTGSAS